MLLEITVIGIDHTEKETLGKVVTVYNQNDRIPILLLSEFFHLGVGKQHFPPYALILDSI